MRKIELGMVVDTTMPDSIFRVNLRKPRQQHVLRICMPKLDPGLLTKPYSRQSNGQFAATASVEARRNTCLRPGTKEVA